MVQHKIGSTIGELPSGKNHHERKMSQWQKPPGKGNGLTVSALGKENGPVASSTGGGKKVRLSFFLKLGPLTSSIQGSRVASSIIFEAFGLMGDNIHNICP